MLDALLALAKVLVRILKSLWGSVIRAILMSFQLATSGAWWQRIIAITLSMIAVATMHFFPTIAVPVAGAVLGWDADVSPIEGVVIAILGIWLATMLAAVSAELVVVLVTAALVIMYQRFVKRYRYHLKRIREKRRLKRSLSNLPAHQHPHQTV